MTALNPPGVEAQRGIGRQEANTADVHSPETSLGMRRKSRRLGALWDALGPVGLSKVCSTLSFLHEGRQTSPSIGVTSAVVILMS
ncbi:hypothetical protein E2C01_048131 [Portunus trituberculatus]|uniref:Uncharacterized protein n=1 Tax=Portunus trituberculatus TaxID=210409 RepID=A0A5B7G5L2_PORTR|nr:hypothetical protein [Portunus trituberculatus]